MSVPNVPTPVTQADLLLIIGDQTVTIAVMREQILNLTTQLASARQSGDNMAKSRFDPALAVLD